VFRQPVPPAQEIPVEQSPRTAPITIHKRVNKSDHEMYDATFHNGMNKFLLILVVEKIEEVIHQPRNFRMVRWHMDGLAVDSINHIHLVVGSETTLVLLIVQR